MGDIYCGALVSSDYLAHHGIKGMRWGVRRFQNKDGSLTSAGKKRKLMNEQKNEETRKAVKEYTKKFNKANKASDDADELWRDAKETYKSTGKTGITRVINNATKGRFANEQTKKAISEYSKKYNKASKASDDADKLWEDAKSAYKTTGKNRLSRIANNIKYDSDLEKARARKEANRKRKNEETRKAVKKYIKKFNKANKASDDADELWLDAKESYKSTGKTGITRVINNATKGRFANSQTKKAISEYSKKYNKASKAYDDADKLWEDAKSAYKTTGKNRLSRIANNIKYDPDRRKKKRR